MKFFTNEVHLTEIDEVWRAAFKAYREHIESLRGVVPDHVIALSQLAGVDDGLIIKVDHNPTERTLVLTLRCGDLLIDYYDLVLEYLDADISLDDLHILARIARTTLSEQLHESDLFIHELDIGPDGQIEHRIAFHVFMKPYAWFTIRCSELFWNQIPRQKSRKLPRYKDRFPGGPRACAKTR